MKHRVWLFAAVGSLFVSSCSSQSTPVSPLIPASTVTPAVQPALQAQDLNFAFEDSGQRLGMGRSWAVELGDLDADGDLDAVVANDMRAEAESAVWLNDGLGGFTDGGQELGYGMNLALGDLDGDQDLDVFFVSWDEPARVWFNDGHGRFTDSGQGLGTKGGWDVGLGDLDGDGDLDAVIAHEKADTVWMNTGDGNFTDSGQALGTTYSAAVELGDLDGDGDLDAITVGWDEAGRAWQNDGTGMLQDYGQALTAGSIHMHGMALGDVTGNGALDALMLGAPNQVWFNAGDGTFIDSEQKLVARPGDTAALADLDGDGDLDVYLAIGTAGNSADAIWLNDGQGHFVESGLALSADFTSGVGLGDLDGDGDLDAFITHGQLGQATGGGIPNEVWFNETLWNQ